jgi:hypothetical protein
MFRHHVVDPRNGWIDRRIVVVTGSFLTVGARAAASRGAASAPSNIIHAIG